MMILKRVAIGYCANVLMIPSDSPLLTPPPLRIKLYRHIKNEERKRNISKCIDPSMVCTTRLVTGVNSAVISHSGTPRICYSDHSNLLSCVQWKMALLSASFKTFRYSQTGFAKNKTIKNLYHTVGLRSLLFGPFKPFQLSPIFKCSLFIAKTWQ